MSYFTPAGKYFDSSSIFARTAFAVSSAFAVGESNTPTAEVGLPFRRAAVE